jgi:hypothetical protein
MPEALLVRLSAGLRKKRGKELEKAIRQGNSPGKD